jgi:hypothetical protein
MVVGREGDCYPAVHHYLARHPEETQRDLRRHSPHRSHRRLYNPRRFQHRLLRMLQLSPTHLEHRGRCCC